MANADEQIEILRYLHGINQISQTLDGLVLYWPESVSQNVRVAVMEAFAAMSRARRFSEEQTSSLSR